MKLTDRIRLRRWVQADADSLTRLADNRKIRINGWPTLIAAQVIGRCPLWEILPDRTRRHAQGEFQQQLMNLCRSMIGLCRMSLLYSITVYRFGIPPCVERHRVFVAKLWAMWSVPEQR